MVQVREGLYYNPYFPGGAIAMPKMLVDGGVEYDDGTPSSASQQAKVNDANTGCCFLPADCCVGTCRIMHFTDCVAGRM
jgi:hypothetical protein